MNILVICEKPSMAQTVAAVLGASHRKDGYFQGSNFLISWCYGHLVELAPVDAKPPCKENSKQSQNKKGSVKLT